MQKTGIERRECSRRNAGGMRGTRMLAGLLALFPFLLVAGSTASQHGDARVVAKGVFAASPGKETVAVRKAANALGGNRQSDADTLIYTYTFPAPTFDDHADGTSTVRMNGVENFGEVGNPSLPTLPVRLAIPKDRELVSVECDGVLEPVASGRVLSHVRMPVPTGATATDETERNESVYGSDEPFPERCFSDHSIANKRGIQFVDFLLNPVSYGGLSGDVSYYPEITVVLSLKPQDNQTPRHRTASGSDAPGVRSKDDTDAVMSLLDNPEEVESYAPAETPSAIKRAAKSADYSSKPYVKPSLPCQLDGDFPDGYQHVVITSEALLDAFKQLVAYRRGQGVSSTAVTVEQIKEKYSGTDTQEKIRNFIKDAYMTWNTEYVVLGGDTGHVPARGLYCVVNGRESDNIPSDLYYQCLDGNFNDDGDSVWGESNDGIDYYAEVAIGRIPAENSNEVENWYQKLVQYNHDIANDAPYTHRMLSVGEDMNSNGADWGSSRYASVFLEQTRKGGTYDGYTTKGFNDSETYTTCDTLYDSGSYTWEAAELISKINANKYAVLIHLGHGNYNWNMKLSSSVVDQKIRNSSPIFVYSWACISGAFDKDCVAEHFMTSSKYGCFGGVWNARYGLGSSNGTDGPSHRFERHFWNAAFTVSDSNHGTAGLANQLSHERNASYAKNILNYRWVLYESNLFGDPIQQIDGVTLSGGGGSPLQIAKPSVSFPPSGGPGSADVTASSSWTATPSDSWITLKTTAGNGNGTILYTVSANTGTEDRTGTITVNSGTQTAMQRISQSKEAAKLSVSPSSNTCGCDADTGSFEVQANYSWTVEKSASWITLDTTQGIGNGTVSYSVGGNTGKTKRTGTITVKLGTLTATHDVTQSAQPVLEIGPSSATVSASSETGSFAVTSDSTWTVSKSSSSTWITLRTTEGSENGTVSYSVDANPGARRTGYIYVKSGSVQRTYTLAQRCANTVTFSESSVAIPAGGGKGTVTATVLADGSCSIQAPADYNGDWVSWTRSDTTIDDGCRYTYSWTAEANTTGVARERTIEVILNGTTHACTLIQNPEAGSYRVTYRPGIYGTGDEMSVAKPSGGILMLKGAIYTRSDGYKQKGWATTDGGGKVYDLSGFYTEDKSIVLYPYWESTPGGTTYTITFAPGRHGTGNYQTATKTKGVALTLPGVLYTRDGYKQGGWSTEWSGETKAYELGGSYTTDAEAKLYPYWEEIPDPGDGECNIGFYAPDGWKQPVCLSSSNLAAGVYAPQYVFEQGGGLVLNYCVVNYGDAAVTFNDRHTSLWDVRGHLVKSELESESRTISYNSYMRFRNREYSEWLASLAPGNYALQVYLDPYNELNDPDRSDNSRREWFAVKASGITLGEALDCKSLTFIPNSAESAVFPQTSESVSGGSCVQFGPQATNAWEAALWAEVTGPGTLSFKWKATSEDYAADFQLYVDGQQTVYTWGVEDAAWKDASVSVDDGSHWVRWVFHTTDSSELMAGWLDSVSWSGSSNSPEFSVDGNGTLTGVKLNGTTDLAIPEKVGSTTVRSIGYCAMTNLDITSVTIPSTVTNISDFAFWKCAGLSGVTIPNNVVSIGENAFGDCSGMKSVVLEEGVRSVGNYAFYGCGGLSFLALPASVTSVGQSPFGQCGNLRNISVASGNTRYAVWDNALVDKVSNTLVQYPSGRPESAYAVPAGITGIGYDAFDTVAALANVTLPESVASLGSFAFYNCANLATLEFLGNAPTVGSYAFWGVSPGCKAIVSPQSSGWNVAIPGTWNDLSIAYGLASYTVAYNPGRHGNGSTLAAIKRQGSALPLKGAIFTRPGYEQTGWSLADGGSSDYGLGASYSADKDVTLYPFWTAIEYSVAYNLAGGTAGAVHPERATFDTAFRVSAPAREGHSFMGWMVTSGLDSSTARYGSSAGALANSIDSENRQCSNGANGDVWFSNLTAAPGGKVALTATWAEVDDGSRDIGFYAPAKEGWEFPLCLSSTNIGYLAYAPETEFRQFSPVYLSFCAVNWSRTGSALLQSMSLTITDASGALFAAGEPILLYTLGAFGVRECLNMPLNRYLSGITPGRYRLTLELDPNMLLADPDRSNNSTSLWFTVIAPTEAIPELPSDATFKDVKVALAGSADGHLAENITDVSTYAEYRKWAQEVKGADGKPAGAAAVKASDKAWFSFAMDSPELIEKEITDGDVKIEDFAVSSNGRQLDCTVRIADVEIGDGATTERLKSVFNMESTSKLDNAAFDSETFMLQVAEPENGKVKLTATPTPPKTGDGFSSSSSAVFVRIHVQP
ncbi:MAG: leucine-rich repeat protein [Kiritimatiellae bacterium]|nr:leucine-rich repeat protein [Kiritimatiellia bacterium]